MVTRFALKLFEGELNFCAEGKWPMFNNSLFQIIQSTSFVSGKSVESGKVEGRNELSFALATLQKLDDRKKCAVRTLVFGTIVEQQSPPVTLFGQSSLLSAVMPNRDDRDSEQGQRYPDFPRP